MTNVLSAGGASEREGGREGGRGKSYCLICNLLLWGMEGGMDRGRAGGVFLQQTVGK